MGPYILWPLKAKKSQSSVCTSICMWGVLCAPSTNTGIPCSWASLMMSATGLMVPNTLLTYVMLSSFVRSVKYVAMSSQQTEPSALQPTRRPSSVMGRCFTTMPRRSACNCQGTMLLWCSISVTNTSSPGCICDSQKDDATKLMASVVPRVKMISSVFLAWMNARTFSRAASCRSVACCER